MNKNNWLIVFGFYLAHVVTISDGSTCHRGLSYGLPVFRLPWMHSIAFVLEMIVPGLILWRMFWCNTELNIYSKSKRINLKKGLSFRSRSR